MVWRNNSFSFILSLSRPDEQSKHSNSGSPDAFKSVFVRGSQLCTRRLLRTAALQGKTAEKSSSRSKLFPLDFVELSLIIVFTYFLQEDFYISQNCLRELLNFTTFHFIFSREQRPEIERQCVPFIIGRSAAILFSNAQTRSWLHSRGEFFLYLFPYFSQKWLAMLHNDNSF